MNIKETAFGLLDAELQTQLYNQMIANQKKYLAHVAELEKQMANQSKVIGLLTNEGIDARTVSPISQVAEFLNFENPEELEVLLKKNKIEYLKRVYGRYNTLQTEKKRQYDDAQLDLEGKVVYDILNGVKEFFTLHPETGSITSKDIPLYAENVRNFLRGFKMMVEWTKLDADLSTVDEAAINLFMHYFMQELVEAKQSRISAVSVDYEKELEKMPPPEEAPVPAPANGQNATDRLAELEKKVGKMDASLDAILGKLNTLKPGEPEGGTDGEAPDELDAGDGLDDAPEERRPIKYMRKR